MHTTVLTSTKLFCVDSENSRLSCNPVIEMNVILSQTSSSICTEWSMISTFEEKKVEHTLHGFDDFANCFLPTE